MSTILTFKCKLDLHLAPLLFVFLIFSSAYCFTQTTETDSKDQVFTIVEEMPVFGKCKKKSSDQQLSECTIANVHNYISENLKYPEAARLENKEGTVFISFVIDRKGKVTDATIVRGIADAAILNSEAMRVIEEMPKWQPGKQKGKKINVKYTIPIRFALKSE